jgi:hypothetical protein
LRKDAGPEYLSHGAAKSGLFVQMWEGDIMVRKLLIVGFAGALMLVGSGITMAIAGNNITTPETLVLTETDLNGRGVDVGKPGFGPGDSFIFTSSLTDPADGSRVGTVRGQCTLQIGHWQTCQVGAFINGRGEIFVSGVVHSTNQLTAFDLPITGGTGEFDNVRGSVNVDQVSNNVSKDTLTLIP